MIKPTLDDIKEVISGVYYTDWAKPPCPCGREAGRAAIIEEHKIGELNVYLGKCACGNVFIAQFPLHDQTN